MFDVLVFIFLIVTVGVSFYICHTLGYSSGYQKGARDVLKQWKEDIGWDLDDEVVEDHKN